MSTLSQAPLIEAIFELRWGEYRPSNTEGSIQATTLGFSDDDLNIYQGQFRSIAVNEGFGYIERVNDMPVNQAPYLVGYRYRKKEGTWPCFQTGLGIFTVNQINDGYEWSEFYETIKQGLRLFENGHPKGLAGLPGLTVDMKYQDAFRFNRDETPLDFLKEKMNLDFQVPEKFINDDHLIGDIQNTSLGFSVRSANPEGELNIALQTGKVNGEPGYVMNTIVRSKPYADELTQNYESIISWCDRAHNLQKHAFESLIQSTYREEFK